MREADARRLYSDGTGRPAPPVGGVYAADFLVTPLGRGPRGWFGGDAEAALGKIPIPTIGHEIGQYCAYPDFAVIEKFSGKGRYAVFADGIGLGHAAYMHPGNYVIMRDSARASGLLEKNKALAAASGRFQLACYKEEIEAQLRTPSSSGYELLDLHDYLGQGGALIGVLDAFWESKGYVTPAEFRQFNGATAPLARFHDRTYTTGGTLTVEVELCALWSEALAGDGDLVEAGRCAGKERCGRQICCACGSAWQGHCRGQDRAEPCRSACAGAVSAGGGA